jgi:probable rRNA maturation factor
MSGKLYLFNRQRTRPIDRRQLRWMTRALLTDLLHLEEFDLTIHLVSEREMTRINETHLQHAGSTDVITFDYCEDSGTEPIVGELFICVDEAIIQARRFRTTWQSEVIRYIVHGLLHLLGHDDLNPVARKKMKGQENKLLKALGTQFRLSKIAGKSRLNA